MKYYLISIGGTGAKCLEAFVHMNAAGMMKNQGEIKIIYVDPDASNGNLSRTKNTVAAYVNAFRGMSQESDFFKNPISPEDTTWNPVPTSSNTNLKTIFDRSNMDVKAKNLDSLFDVLFTEEEQNTILTEGFRAHPAIGAAVIGANMNLDEEGSVWQKMVSDIGEQEARIFFFGSVFGGTGAAGFPNIAKIIRKYFNDKANNNNPDSKVTKKDERVKMAGCLMLPYFTFPKATEADMTDPNDPTKKIIVPDSGKFLASTYAALNYYDTSNLVGDAFDAVYLLGDRQLVSIDKYKAGRADQKNNAHFLEVMAALSAFDFFNKDSKDDYFSEPKCYMLALLGDELSWKDFPPVYPGCNMEIKLKTFIRMAYMYRSMVFPKLKECYEDTTEEKYSDNVWIGDFLHEMRPLRGKFAGVRGMFGSKEKDQAYITDENYKILVAFEEYCIKFLSWLKDFTYSEVPGSLRGDRMINSLIYAYDDEKSYDDNFNDPDGCKVVAPNEIFIDKMNTTFDEGENNFLQQLINSDPENIKGVRPMIGVVYEKCADGKEVK